MKPTERWEADLPINLAQLAKAQGVSYSAARTWAADPSFPRVGRFTRRSDFLRWWKQKAALLPIFAHPQPPAADKPGAQPPNCDLPTSLPPRAARLRDAALSHK